MNYSYLVVGEFDVEENRIVLEFTTHTVKLKGIFLQKLYDDLMHQVTMRVMCADSRYNQLATGEALW